MISSLTIRNFQCHKRLHLKLDPTVTTIVGRSDAGKSAIVRALQWLATNKPRGDAFIRRWKRKGKVVCAPYVSVTVKADGHTITRKRGKGVNCYILDGRKYKAFGAEVPKEVLNVLQLKPLNFQNQIDPPFWFASTPGEVSKQLNKVVDLTLIDSTLTHLSKAIRQNNAEEGVVRERLRGARVQRRTLSSSKVADKALRRVEALDTASRTMALRASTLHALLASATLAHKTRTDATNALLCAQGAMSLGDAYSDANTDMGLLEDILENAQEAQGKATPPPPTTRLEGLAEEWVEQRDKTLTLSNLITVCACSRSKWRNSRRALNTHSKRLTEEIGDICPLCGNKVQRTPF